MLVQLIAQALQHARVECFPDCHPGQWLQDSYEALSDLTRGGWGTVAELTCPSRDALDSLD